jgi:hypothetical protein
MHGLSLYIDIWPHRPSGRLSVVQAMQVAARIRLFGKCLSTPALLHIINPPGVPRETRRRLTSALVVSSLKLYMRKQRPIPDRNS